MVPSGRIPSDKSSNVKGNSLFFSLRNYSGDSAPFYVVVFQQKKKNNDQTSVIKVISRSASL